MVAWEGADEFAGWFEDLSAEWKRAAILLLGGDKTGNDRWYDEHVPIADTLYDEYVRELEREGLT